jgi:hypothetical protein
MIRASDGAPILLDFGASRFEIKQHSTLVSALVFKSGYSAPEQYTSNANRYGPWTDIYAFGCTLYRAISGSRPMEATSRQLKDEVMPVAQVAKTRYRDNFLKAIDWSMRLPPDERPKSISEWRRTLLESGPQRSSAARMTRVMTGVTTLVPSREEPRAEPQQQEGSKAGRIGIAVAAIVALLFAGAFATKRFLPDTWATLAGLAKPGGNVANVGGAGECGSGPCWGVIVEKNGAVFARVKERSKDQAETAALNLCAQRVGASGCRVLGVVSKAECWALSESPTNRHNWRAARGDTVEEARSRATRDCERDFGLCRVDVTFCADGSQRVGGMD